jgi:uncharacterized damage-inducible protein DinB
MESTSAKRTSVICGQFTKELEAEARATRECLEQVPMDKPDWKPHEKSMQLGYLATLVADIPRWLQHIIEQGVVDFQTYEQRHPKTADELVALFDENMELARKALGTLADENLTKEFQLRNGDQLLWTSPLGESISSSINHMVHHRGQLTVYLRLNDGKVPSIYGPSADSPDF